MFWILLKKSVRFLWALFKTVALLIWVLISILAVISLLMDVFDEDPEKMAGKFVRKVQGILLHKAFKSLILYTKWEWKHSLKK